MNLASAQSLAGLNRSVSAFPAWIFARSEQMSHTRPANRNRLPGRGLSLITLRPTGVGVPDQETMEGGAERYLYRRLLSFLALPTGIEPVFSP
jgi:hypothetical protein